MLVILPNVVLVPVFINSSKGMSWETLIRSRCCLQQPSSNPVKKENQALAGWLSWLEHRAVHQKVVVLIPGWGDYGRQLIDVSVSHRCFSPPSSLKSMAICSGEDLKKNFF